MIASIFFISAKLLIPAGSAAPIQGPFWRRGRVSAAGGSIASDKGSRHRAPVKGQDGAGVGCGASSASTMAKNRAADQTVGPHSPEPKILHDVSPAFATTIRPDL